MKLAQRTIKHHRNRYRDFVPSLQKHSAGQRRLERRKAQDDEQEATPQNDHSEPEEPGRD